MKNLILLLTVLALTFFGCQEQFDITAPAEQDIVENQITAEPNWLGLPKAKETRLQKIHSTSEFITVANGGELIITDTYISANGDTVEVYLSLKFDPGCVQQDVNISMELDDETGVSTFLPAQVFNFPAIINQRISGFDFSGINTNNIGFYYMRPDNTYEEMDYDNIIIDEQTGTIEVVNGRIPHFSRYGFHN